MLGLIYVLGRNFDVGILGVFFVAVPHDGLHLDDVDDALVVGFAAVWQLQNCRNSLQAVFDHVEGAIEVGTGAVHLVDEAHTRNFVLVGLAPHSFGLWLNTSNRVEYGNCTVEYAQRALYFNGEVHVARGVDDVDAMIAPERCGCSRSNGDAALLFLHHVVHHGAAFVHFTDLVCLTRVIQHALGGGGFARIDVGHNANVAVTL